MLHLFELTCNVNSNQRRTSPPAGLNKVKRWVVLLDGDGTGKAKKKIPVKPEHLKAIC